MAEVILSLKRKGWGAKRFVQGAWPTRVTSGFCAILKRYYNVSWSLLAIGDGQISLRAVVYRRMLLHAEW